MRKSGDATLCPAQLFYPLNRPDAGLIENGMGAGGTAIDEEIALAFRLLQACRDGDMLG
jgi:hypothetical protein